MIHFALKTKKPQAPLAFRVSYEYLNANWNWKIINYSHITALLHIIKRTNGHHISLSLVFNVFKETSQPQRERQYFLTLA